MRRWTMAVKEFLRLEWPVLLIWSCLLLIPVGRLVELPLLVMAILGVRVLWKKQISLRYGPGLWFSLAFLIYLVPILISATDAIRVQRTLEVGISQLRFYLSGCFFLYALARPKSRALFLKLSAWTLVFWVVDGYLQALFDWEIFGLPHPRDKLGAVFGNSAKYGIILATLLPILWEYTRQTFRTTVWVVTIAVTVYLVFLSGSRAAWIIVGASLLFYVLILAWRRPRLVFGSLGAIAVAAVLMGWVAYASDGIFARKINDALRFFEGQATATNQSFAHRMLIWKVASRIFLHHPINGVGARDFRYAYPLYADPDDPFITKENPYAAAAHSHQMLLEVGSETGLIGLVGLFAVWWIMFRLWRRSDPDTRRRLLPYGLALIGAYFPLNTHLAFYSSVWSQILWWLTGLYFAAAMPRDQGRQEPPAEHYK